MPDIVFVHAPEPQHPGGGADIRARALAAEMNKKQSTELIIICPGGDVEADPRMALRLRAAAQGVPPRFSQRFDPRARTELRRRIADAKVVVAETLFTLPYLSGVDAAVVLDAHNVESHVVSRLAQRHPAL